MKRILLTAIALLMLKPSLFAEEGMWLLPYLQKFNAAEMKESGLKIDLEEIYSEKNVSIKDAIVIFGGGCTGEVISNQGLVLTNHHCGYGAIQQHSTVEEDYLKNGFWAQSLTEEIPTPGLKVTFIKSITDVTGEIIPELKSGMSEKERTEKINKIIEKLISSTKLKDNEKARVHDYFGGNQYMLIVTQDYNDVRMVGAPPSSIGKFGGDTDNWMWPRHTGDFALFRIYADKDGNPADYSVDNKPLVPKRHLTISLAGVKKGDYTMILGFPGSTKRYMSSYEIDEVMEQDNPIRIKVRGLRQDILLEDMKADPKIKIQYASKYSGSSNYWKNSIGMNRGLRRLNVKADKIAIEDSFRAWVNSGDVERKDEYGDALELKEKAVEGRRPYTFVSQYISESLLRGIELLSFANMFDSYKKELALEEAGEKNDLKVVTEKIKKSVESFYKNYSPSTDRKVSKVMIKTFLEDVDEDQYPEMFKQLKGMSSDEINVVIDDIYENSIFANNLKLQKFFENPSVSVIENDMAYKVSQSVMTKYKEVGKEITEYSEMFRVGHRKFIDGLMQMDKNKKFYPDANFTIRLTYGSVLPYKPADAVTYDYITTLKGVIEKEDPNNAYDFTVPAKLKELYNNKDFGDYAVDGDVPVAFISNNDITGGNSGSPVLNDKGELVGTAFDGNWEAMSGDIAFEPALQRTISVDIRYTLFIIDKFAGARRLIDEMTIVK